MNKNFFLAFLILLAGAFCSFSAFSDKNNFLTAIVNSFKAYINQANQRKIYLHSDKSYYISGETIWFKAYIREANTLLPQSAGEVLHVNVYDKKGKLIIENNFYVENSVCQGSIDMPDTLSTGEYTIAAYTNWSRNFGQDLFFKKVIPVYNLFMQPKATQVEKDIEKGVDVQFFPESGDLVYGIESTVAFKAINPDGLGEHIQGFVLNQENQKVASFASLHGGMGSFTFKPVAGQVYQAAIINNNQDTMRFSLPEPKESGIVLSVNNQEKDLLKVSIQSSLPQQAEEYALVAQSGGEIVYKQLFSLKDGAAFFEIPAKEFKTGIANLTLFNQSLQPLGERLFFVDKGDYMKFAIQQQKKTYAPREKVELEVSPTDKDGNLVAANFSIAVIPATKQAYFSVDNSADNIISHLLLSSELKGYIENPIYYFSGDKNASKALDNLLLTQGWRRYEWHKILAGTPQLPYAIENSLGIKGRLINTKNNQPVAQKLVTLSVTGEKYNFQYTNTDKEGFFYFEDVTNNKNEIIIQTTNPYEEGIKIELFENEPKESLAWNIPNLLYQSVQDADFLKKEKKIRAIQNSYRAAISEYVRKKEITDPYNDVIEINDYIQFPNMVEIIREIVPGVIIRKKKDRYKMRLLNRDSKLYYKHEPFYVVDGIPVFDNRIVLNMDTAEVKTIEVLRSTDRLEDYGPLALGGAIIVHTRNGNFIAPNLSGSLRTTYKGFTPQKEFYSPKYEVKNKSITIPDFRNTIYWNPQVKVREDGKAQVSFYTSDEINAFEIVVEGISADGKPGYAKAFYEVKFQ